MRVSVCRMYLLFCSNYVMLLLNGQQTLSQKPRPSKWRDMVLQDNVPLTAFQSTENARLKKASRQRRSKRPGQIDFRNNMETSCRDKCGQLFDLPCSCDIQCLVYKNCCEDLYLECPKMLVEAESLYTPELLNNQIDCIHSGMLAISGCPKGSSVDTANLSNAWINDHWEKMSRLQAALSGNESLTKTEEDSQVGAQSEKQGQSVHELLSNVPVSDISTGLLYKSPEIFSCNIGPESVSALWTIKIATSKILSGLQQIQHLTPEKDEVEYIPPAQLPVDNIYRFCFPDAIGICKHPQDKCEASLSYVYVPGPRESFVIYNNKYCALCNEWNEENIYNLTYYKGLRIDFPLSLIMSLSNDKMKLSMVGQERIMKIVAWEEAECNLSNERQVREKGKMSACHIDSCSNMNVMQSDGSCKSLREFRVALSDYGHTPFSASAVEFGNGQDLKKEDGSQKMTVDGPLGALPDLIRCTLETHFGYELGEKTYPPLIRYDHRLNATMFVVDVQEYMALEKGVVEQMDLSTSAISLIAKSLFLYDSTWYLTPRRKLGKIKESYNRGILEEIKTLDGSVQNSNMYHFSFQAQNCSGILDIITICVCDMQLPTFLINSDEPCRLKCFEDKLCKNQVEEIQAFSEAKCFSLFRRLASCGSSCTMKYSAFVWFLILSIIMN